LKFFKNPFLYCRWKCGTPITRPAVPGTVIVVVFVTNSITAGTGFTFTYESSTFFSLLLSKMAGMANEKSYFCS